MSREARTRDVVEDTGLGKRFYDGRYSARNLHMRGTTSLLRLPFGRASGRNYDGDLVPVGGSSVHTIEMIALAHSLLWAAVAVDVGEPGSKHGRSTKEMERNGPRHFSAVMCILEPKVIAAQGKVYGCGWG